MDIIKAETIFAPNKVQEMKDLVEINEQMKILEAKKKVLVDKVKGYMVGSNIDKTDVDGATLSVIESTRKTVTKATKDEFIASLVGMGKNHLVQYSIEPDLDSIFAEVDAGSLKKDFVDSYVKVTPVTTLRCN